MNHFEQALKEVGIEELRGCDLSVLQVNVGLVCNQRCSHCHLDAGPARNESMTWRTMELVLRAAQGACCRLVDITGGAPELNPAFRRFVETLAANGLSTQVRTNLSVLLEPGMEDLPEFFAEFGVTVVGSLPCYLEENVDAQRGDGAHEKSIEAVRRLNRAGFGVKPHLALNLVYNPAGPILPPNRATLEDDYRRALKARFGIVFTNLPTIANMPIGRFLDIFRGRSSEDAAVAWRRVALFAAGRRRPGPPHVERIR